MRVLFQARIPLTLVLSPQIRGEARKVSEISFNFRKLTISEHYGFKNPDRSGAEDDPLTKARAQRRLTASIVPASDATLQRYGSSLAVVMIMAMVAMRSPMPVIPGVSRARVTVRIRLGIRVVRPLISTRMDNNCSASDRHNGTPEIQN